MQINVRHEDVIIDEEFQKLLPPLTENVFSDLEKSLLQFGVRDPLVLWDDILVDGYNRYAISQKHGLPFNTISMEFPSRDNVIVWIIKNQMERRNLTPTEVRRYRGIHYNTLKRIQGTNNQYLQKSESGQNDHPHEIEITPGKTADLLAELYNVSSKTIRRDAQIANTIDSIGEISPETQFDILAGKTRITNKQLQELSSASTEEIKAVISQIEDGTFVSRQSSTKTTDSENTYSTTEVPQWEIEFTKMTEEFRQMIKSQSKPNDTTVVKTALRQYIEMLEELYRGI